MKINYNKLLNIIFKSRFLQSYFYYYTFPYFNDILNNISRLYVRYKYLHNEIDKYKLKTLFFSFPSESLIPLLKSKENIMELYNNISIKNNYAITSAIENSKSLIKLELSLISKYEEKEFQEIFNEILSKFNLIVKCLIYKDEKLIDDLINNI